MAYIAAIRTKMNNSISPLLREESILNHLPVNKIQERDLVFLDALSHTVKMINIMYGRLFYLLLKQKTKLLQENIMIEVWGLVDGFNRVRILLNKASGIKKNTPWFQLFSRKLQAIEDIRHFLQHYDEKIEYLVTSNQPLVGHLCWVKVLNDKEFEINLIQPGRLKKTSLKMLNPLGKDISYVIDLITFYLGEKEVNLSELVKGLKVFVGELEVYLEDKHNSPANSTNTQSGN